MRPTVDNHPLVRKLELFAPLGDEEKAALRAAPAQIRMLDSREDLLREDDPPLGVNLVLEGLVYRYKLLPGGRRQILAWLLQGDLCDARMVFLKQMDHAIAAFVPSRVAIYSPEALADVGRRYPRVRRAIWWSHLVSEAITRQWMVNLGQRTAVERAAHLICEMHYRMRAVGLAREDRFFLPVTQHELGDTLGLSTVHVNRILQELRRDGLINQQGREMIVLDQAGLRRVAGFDPKYLHPVAGEDEPDEGWSLQGV